MDTAEERAKQIAQLMTATLVAMSHNPPPTKEEVNTIINQWYDDFSPELIGNAVNMASHWMRSMRDFVLGTPPPTAPPPPIPQPRRQRRPATP